MNYDLDAKMPGAAYIFHGLYASLALLFAFVMSPVVLYCLFKLKKYHWIAAFFLLIMAPLLIAHLFIGSMGLYWILVGSALLTWVVYNAVLRATLSEWKEPIFINRKNTD